MVNDETRDYHRPLLAEVRGQDQQEAGTFVAALGSAQGQYLRFLRYFLIWCLAQKQQIFQNTFDTGSCLYS